MQDQRHAILLNEIRYAERLTQRTSRLYRRAASFCTFTAILGGSGVLSGLSDAFPDWMSAAGVLLIAIAGAAALTVRPLEKAITNETDAKKYSALRTQGVGMDSAELEAALQKARESDAPEVESLRDVAYNDLLVEIGRDDMKAPLTARQRFFEALA